MLNTIPVQQPQTKRDMNHRSVEESASRVWATLLRFEVNPQDVLDMLRTTRGVVSGSAALLMVSDLNFEPGDLDIYVPASQDQTALVLADKRLGYELRRSSARMYGNNKDIKRVHVLTKGRNKLNIITTKGENAVAAIFQFHSTVVMNMLTPSGLYCAYPTLTLKQRGVANLPALLKDASASNKARECYEKYRRRGIQIVNDVTKIPGFAHHECFTAAECPLTTRHTSDGKGLYVEIFKQETHERERREADEYITIWMVGGPMCARGTTYCDGFTKSIKTTSISETVLAECEI
ncbi:hypothetical protein C8F04DRAFT_1118265 [Mycena alexandri]|uniref:Uncharacterized protein n=1 Tax=Mycena alexandri TaxID=1745969 RepID=A0AAD6SL05_9AGAR|nr:hypothetical protein C8F04DRAFT_1118265 [Mycena alexandri]